MIEIHAWITFRYSDYDSEDHLQRDFIANFKGYLAQHYDWVLGSSYGRFINQNGLECFAIDAQHNHKGSFYVLDIFSWVAKESTGSYGLLYFHDDEDQKFFNEFQVYVLKRGKLTKSKDLFLSPYQEEVEREYDDNNPPKD